MQRFDAVDLSQLPAPNVIQVPDVEVIIAARIADLAARVPAIAEALQYEGDPSVKVQETGAYRELIHFTRVNDAARALLVAYAVGSDLDNLGALFGVVRMDGEGDARFRTRITLAPNAYSNAGPAGGIAYECLSADIRVKDVGLSMIPYTGKISVYILSTEAGGVPSQPVLDAVRARLYDNAVKLMTDIISVHPAVIYSYTVAATLVIPVGPDPSLVVAAARAAVKTYTDAQFIVDAPVYAQIIAAAMRVPNVANIIMSSPMADIASAKNQAPLCASITLTPQVSNG